MGRIKVLPITAISDTPFSITKTGRWRYETPEFRNKLSPCNEACPAGNDIEGFMVLTKEGKFREAWELIKEENPFPGVCGRVCFHPCEFSCNRKEYDEALSIHAIERFLADSQINTKSEKHQTNPKKKEKVAIIGSGPAGLTCAYHLARMGYSTAVFEAHSSPGGILRTGIPEYRLPRSILDHEISDIESWGVEIRTNTSIGKDIAFQDLKTFQAIFISTGAHHSRNLEITHEEGRGILSGLDLLKRIRMGERPSLGEKMIVIGGGNVAIDVARSALRLGIRTVEVYYRRSREEMPAIPGEVEEALLEGVKIHFLTSPIKVIREREKAIGIECVKMTLGRPDESGRRRPFPIEGSNFQVYGESVILAIGEVPNLSFLPQEVPVKDGLVQNDETGLVHPKGIFAGGDVSNPSHSVVEAIGSGKKAALAIHEYIRGGSLKEKFPMIRVGGKGTVSLKKYFHPPEGETNLSVVPFKEINTDYFEHLRRISNPSLPIEERKGTFKEVYAGLDRKMAEEEASRCFTCGTCNMCGNCYIFCPDLAINLISTKNVYEIDYDHCKGCLICLEECPRNVISLKV